MEFHHSLVRDLAWVIGSPVLLSQPRQVTDPWCRQAFVEHAPWLRSLDQCPDVLEAWITTRPTRRLGLYFEDLVEFWLVHSPRFEFIARGVKVVADDGRDRGEFDFLFTDRRRGQTVHWETAVKFYLCHVHGATPADWLGPNPRDTLTTKQVRLFERQLRLSEQPEARAVLKTLGIERLTPEAFVKGYLFYPLRPAPQPVPGLGISPRHGRGWWLYVHEAERLPRGARWQVLDRLQWLAPAIVPTAAMDLQGLLGSLSERFGHGREAPLLVAELGRGDDGGWREVSRGFVVGERWPQ